MKNPAIQPLDAVTLTSLALELQSLLAESRVAKLSHPSAFEFVITFWGGATRTSKKELLYIHLNPEAPCVALLPAKQRQSLTLNTFDKPTGLCMLLRKLLNGAVFQQATTLPGERVLNLIFENYNELGQRVHLVLSIELMGKHTNMILYDEPNRTMLAVAHGVSESMSRHRELAAGLPYAPPPFPVGKKLLSSWDESDWVEFYLRKPPSEEVPRYLNQHVAGWGLRMLGEVCQHATGSFSSPVTRENAQAIYTCMNALEAGEALSPAISTDGFRFSLLGEFAEEPDTSSWRPFESVHDMLGEYFVTSLHQLRLSRKREQLTGILLRRRERVVRRQQELSGDDSGLIAHWQATGDRLLAAYSTGEVPRHGSEGRSTITLSSYEQMAIDMPSSIGDLEPAWTIEVDPLLGWVENAALYYRRARKAKARQELRQRMATPLQDALDFLDSLSQLIHHADSLDELAELSVELDTADILLLSDGINQPNLDDLPGELKLTKGGKLDKSLFPGKSGKANKPAKHKSSKATSMKKGKAAAKKEKEDNFLLSGVQRLRTSLGEEVLLGKTAKGNDAIIGRLSRSDDWWFHVHQMPGSHVLVRNSGEGRLSNETLEEAAMLSAYYSSGRQGLNVPVVFTQIKYVRKIPHSYPGHVNYRQEETIFISPDPARLGRLLETVLE